eukprot:127878-Chlamydomonas_euryale.AAC.1
MRACVAGARFHTCVAKPDGRYPLREASPSSATSGPAGSSCHTSRATAMRRPAKRGVHAACQLDIADARLARSAAVAYLLHGRRGGEGMYEVKTERAGADVGEVGNIGHGRAPA